VRRLFVAAEISQTMRAALGRVVDVLRRREVEGNIVPERNYHLTLAFLGDVPAAAVPSVAAALTADLSAVPRVSLHLERITAFPTWKRPTSIRIGPAHPPAELLELSRAVRASLSDLVAEIPPLGEPHVTLVRNPRPRRGVVPLEIDPLPPTEITRVTLYRSVRADAGTRYLPITSVTLARPGVDAVGLRN